MTRFVISDYRENAECDLSGRTDEVIEVTTDDGAFQASFLSFHELKKQIRQRFRQERRNNGHVGDEVVAEAMPDDTLNFSQTSDT